MARCPRGVERDHQPYCLQLTTYYLLLTTYCLLRTSHQGVERDHQPHGLRRPAEELEAGEVCEHEARPECEAAHEAYQAEEPRHRHRVLARHLARSVRQVVIGKWSLASGHW